MNGQPAKRDLVVLAACGNGEYAMRGILSRHPSLGIKAVNPDYFVHPEKDPGVFKQADGFLRQFIRTHNHAIVLLDIEGSGKETRLTRTQMESDIEHRLQASGWNAGDVAAVVVEPELEAWVWSDSPQVDLVLGWTDRNPDLRSWLRDPAQGFLSAAQIKPQRPKEALAAVLRQLKKPRSSSLYQELAEKVSLNRCTDVAFGKLKGMLQQWF